MKSRFVIGTLLVFTLALTACGTPTPTAPPPTQPPATQPPATQPPVSASTDTPAASYAPTEAAPTSAPTQASASAVTIMTSTKDGITGSYLVDSQGRSLYIFLKDTQNGGTSACSGNCAKNWPALIVTETPSAGTGVDATKFGTITLPDGSKQATYNGWPLYYYASDGAAGDTNGQGFGGNWYLVSADGNAVK